MKPVYYIALLLVTSFVLSAADHGPIYPLSEINAMFKVDASPSGNDESVPSLSSGTTIEKVLASHEYYLDSRPGERLINITHTRIERKFKGIIFHFGRITYSGIGPKPCVYVGIRIPFGNDYKRSRAH